MSLGWMRRSCWRSLVVSVVALRFAWGYFFARSGDFAEEL